MNLFNQKMSVDHDYIHNELHEQAIALGILPAFEYGEKSLEAPESTLSAIIEVLEGCDNNTVALLEGSPWTAEVLLEDGKSVAPAGAPLPSGYHTDIEGRFIIVAPEKLPIDTDSSQFGFMSQIYALRSSESWGIGDFVDLKNFVAGVDADFVLINPIHATRLYPKPQDSPYYPSSRKFINPLYIRPEIEGCVKPSNDTELLDRASVWTVKEAALYEQFKSFDVSLLDDFIAAGGEELANFAAFQAGHSKFRDMTFHVYLQYLADKQFKDVESEGKLIADLAVGVCPTGIDVASHPDAFVHSFGIGAPPDFYNQHGQTWGMPPLNPGYMRKTGYKYFREIIQGALHGASGLRIDHIIGMFRMWWVPEGAKATEGAYVLYDHDIIFNILILEAMRADAIIIGEDLGIVPDFIEAYLDERNILGTDLMWYRHGYFLNLRNKALVSATTHDMPPSLGFMHGEHIRVRSELGLLDTSVDSEFEELNRENGYLIDELKFTGDLSADYDDDFDVIVAMYRGTVERRSMFVCLPIADAVGQVETQNQPGTVDIYPNWRVPLRDRHGKNILLDDLFANPEYIKITNAINAVR
ncbi:MAG: 4-alpha-glucanotransferase [Lactobacillales bacterium]|jgi:4-alpha-glucanotransferase|nr:4-alpha-glucanotransferase [Lactobacillales bacterium]